MKLVALGALACASIATADPLRLRADALATTASPVGLVTLDAAAHEGMVTAEAAVWTADGEGDVLVIAVRAKDRTGRASGTLGRFVQTLGALRPTHVDGIGGRVRLPHRLDVEAFAGIPVQPRLGARTWDWVAGGRVSRRLGHYGSVGVALLEQREAGRLATSEVGADAGFVLGPRADLGARIAYDLANPGVAEASTSASYRRGALRGELYASYRAASHLIPATSLFSVLGDVPAMRLGSTMTWRAAPRLDVIAEAGVRHAQEHTSPLAVLRGKLRLDAKGRSSIGGELRRDGVADDAWTGARGFARIAIGARYAVATELELVIPDARATAWPWGLVAVSRDDGTWRAAIALEASASPSDVYRVDLLAQLGRRWGK